MTKRYMTFESFQKEFFAEAKKDKFPGAIFWSYKPDPKDPNNKKRGTINFYYTVHKPEAEKDKKWEAAIERQISGRIKKGDASVSFLNFENPSSLETAQQIPTDYDEEYPLKLIKIPYTIEGSTESDEKNFKKIRDFVRTSMHGFTQNNKLYASSELKDTTGNLFNTDEEDLDKVEEYLDDLVNNPEKFGGYKSLGQRLQDASEMDFWEFVHEYASEGPISAMIAKKIIDFLAKKRRDKIEKKKQVDAQKAKPGWKDTFKEIKIKFDQNENTYMYDLSKEVNGYTDKMKFEINDCNLQNVALDNDGKTLTIVAPEKIQNGSANIILNLLDNGKTLGQKKVPIIIESIRKSV